MKFSHYFSPTLKDNPADTEIISHQLMIRAGMVKQASAGIYSWLPLGLKVLKKIVLKGKHRKLGNTREAFCKNRWPRKNCK